MFVIYVLSVGAYGDPRYVGLTEQPLGHRLAQHKRSARRGDKLPVMHWIRKHGEDNIFIRPFCYADDRAMLGQAEMWTIIELRAIGHQLLNLTDGGDGTLGFTPEVRAQIARSLTGRKRPPFTANHRSRIGAAQLGAVRSELSRAQRSATSRNITVQQVLDEWKLCNDCKARYGHRQMIEHRWNGTCARTVTLSSGADEDCSRQVVHGRD